MPGGEIMHAAARSLYIVNDNAELTKSSSCKQQDANAAKAAAAHRGRRSILRYANFSLQAHDRWM
jgi:hypothetical protein